MVNSSEIDFVEADGEVTAYAKTLGIWMHGQKTQHKLKPKL